MAAQGPTTATPAVMTSRLTQMQVSWGVCPMPTRATSLLGLISACMIAICKAIYGKGRARGCFPVGVQSAVKMWQVGSYVSGAVLILCEIKFLFVGIFPVPRMRLAFLISSNVEFICSFLHYITFCNDDRESLSHHALISKRRKNSKTLSKVREIFRSCGCHHKWFIAVSQPYIQNR